MQESSSSPLSSTYWLFQTRLPFIPPFSSRFHPAPDTPTSTSKVNLMIHNNGPKPVNKTIKQQIVILHISGSRNSCKRNSLLVSGSRPNRSKRIAGRPVDPLGDLQIGPTTVGLYRVKGLGIMEKKMETTMIIGVI